MNTDVMFSSKTDDWATPQDLFDYLNDKFHFTLDVCADQDNHKCNKYFTKEDDGLTQSWDGVFWMNPPYGKEIGKWVEKAYNEAYKYSTRPDKLYNVGVLLLPARTDTKWFHEYCIKGEVIFIKGRLKFGDGKNSAPFPSMIVVFNGQFDPETKYPMWSNSNFKNVNKTYRAFSACKLFTLEKNYGNTN